MLIATPDGQIYVINCTGDIICFDLGEPIRSFCIGLYSSELFASTVSLIDPGTSSEIDLYQSNTAFELALDASPISFQNTEDPINNSSLCGVFISSITNKLCLLQTDAILPYSKSKPSNLQFRYKCENVFTKMRSLNVKLAQFMDSAMIKNNPNVSSDIIHEILYSN